MELALHLRDFSHSASPVGLGDHLKRFYSDDQIDAFQVDGRHAFQRLYVGDEFCAKRLPSIKELERACELADNHGYEISLISPYLTDEELVGFSALLTCLGRYRPDAEVIVNDLGVLFYVRRRFPRFHLGVGRLLNKGFKDPRLGNGHVDPSGSQDNAALVNDCTYGRTEFRQMMSTMSVERIEQDMLPYGQNLFQDGGALKQSVYFPFGYVTTGRVCWMAACFQKKNGSFVPPKACARPCNGQTLELKNPQIRFRMVQNGNTVFFVYPDTMLAALFNQARYHQLRLVCQASRGWT